MPDFYHIPDRRVPLAAVLADAVACALIFPLAATMVEPATIDHESVITTLRLLPVALLLINAIVVLLDPPEPPVWSVARAAIAGVWRSTLLFIVLLWTLILTGAAGTVPVGLFIIAWGLLAGIGAILRTVRLATCQRIPL